MRSRTDKLKVRKSAVEEKAASYEQRYVGSVGFDLSDFFRITAEQMWNEDKVPSCYDIAIGLDTYITLFYEACGNRGYLTTRDERRDIAHCAELMKNSLELLYFFYN